MALTLKLVSGTSMAINKMMRKSNGAGEDSAAKQARYSR